MKRIEVSSSTIKSIGYSVKDYTLEVEFLRGAVYRYNNVNSDEVVQLLFAESIGAYFNKYIAKVYEYTKISD